MLIIIGIRECEIIQWFVEPEARVEEFDKICEVQSDKASVDIPSRFTGVIKKLYYEAGEMAAVGKPLVDIDVQGEIEDETPPPTAPSVAPLSSLPGPASDAPPDSLYTAPQSKMGQEKEAVDKSSSAPAKGKHATLATPAVRHLSRELDVDIADVNGTGREGRVTKDDIYKFAAARDSEPDSSSNPESAAQSTFPQFDDSRQVETVSQLTKVQSQMFKTMTRSLNIPHFLYADEIDFGGLVTLRHRLNKSFASSAGSQIAKISFLPFIIKAMSLTLHQYPILNARVEIDGESSKPALVMRSQHNIGIAMDTPQGLLVPVIKNVASLNIMSIANELNRLQSLATSGKLSAADLTGGTITLSNIGNVGGTYVSPVIVDKEVAILGIGKIRAMPAFDEAGQIVKKQICTFSWCADHRVIDGATMARAAEVVKGFLEEPGTMMVHLH